MALSFRIWRDGRMVDEPFDIEDLDVHLADPKTLVWVDLCMAHGQLPADDGEARPAPGTGGEQPSNAQVLEKLAAELSLDRHQVEDAVAPGERPKASRHGDHTFVSVYSVDLVAGRSGRVQDSRLVSSRISAFVMPHGLVTVRRDDRFDMAAVVERWETDTELLDAGVGGLLHGLLDVVVDGHFQTIQQLDDAIEELEDLLFSPGQARTAEVQHASYRLRKELVEMRRVVLPMREVVAVLMRPTEKQMHHDALLQGYFEDLYDHVLRAGEWTESLRDMITSVFETNLSLQDARLNTVMKKLAGWAAVIAVPTAVTGWFGQNVPYPGFESAFGLWQSVVLMVVGTLGLYLTFKKKDWI